MIIIEKTLKKELYKITTMDVGNLSIMCIKCFNTLPFLRQRSTSKESEMKRKNVCITISHEDNFLLLRKIKCKMAYIGNMNNNWVLHFNK